MIFIVAFNHLKAIVFKFFVLHVYRNFIWQNKANKTSTVKHMQTHTYTQHTQIHKPNKQTKKSQKTQFSFPLQSYMKFTGQVVAMCGSAPKAV